VLYVHGWNDYFFQTHLADVWHRLGFAFYAVDLRRYGRSLRPGQLFGFVTDLADYAAELDAAAALIRAEHDELVVMGHSTGGLVAALWAADHPDAVDGVVLNSPWLDLQGSSLLRGIGGPVIARLGNRRPTTALRLPDVGLYARSLHVSQDGEWDYDLAWKCSPTPPIRVGWLRAILQGHQRVAAGLGIDVPVLVLCSTRSDFGRHWHEGLTAADIVLDVEQIARRAGLLGSCVTIQREDGGLHDLVLSAPAVRAKVFEDLIRWVRGYLLPVP
jgi:alpha-beta hydrolase superfamily lysophospholipase